MNFKLLKAAFLKATTGIWEAKGKYSGGLMADWYGVSVKDTKFIDCGTDLGTIQGSERGKEDAEFISLAHNLMPSLLDAVELLEEAKSTMLVDYTSHGDWATSASRVLLSLQLRAYLGTQADTKQPDFVTLFTRPDGQVYGIQKDDGEFQSVVPSDLADKGEGYIHSTIEDAEAYLWPLIYKDVDVDSRFNAAIENAEIAFWDSIADSFPEIKTGDLGPDVVMPFQAVMEDSVGAWLNYNCDGAYKGSIIPKQRLFHD